MHYALLSQHGLESPFDANDVACMAMIEQWNLDNISDIIELFY